MTFFHFLKLHSAQNRMVLHPFSTRIPVNEAYCPDNPVEEHAYPCIQYSHMEISTQQIGHYNTTDKHSHDSNNHWISRIAWSPKDNFVPKSFIQKSFICFQLALKQNLKLFLHSSYRNPQLVLLLLVLLLVHKFS